MHQFPSSSLPKRPRLSEASDPTQPCIGLQQKHKNKSTCVKPSMLSVVAVKDISKGVPRGRYYKELEESACVGKIELTRGMSDKQVNSIITKTFSHLRLKAFLYLVCPDWTTLSTNPDQNLDGNKIITLLQASKGPLYILRCARFQNSQVKHIQNTNIQQPQVTSTINDETTNVSLYFNYVNVFQLVIIQHHDDDDDDDDDVHLPPKDNLQNAAGSDRSRVRDKC